MIRPRKLVEYPWVVVRLECAFCGRRGRYRLARLAARYGPEQDLDGLLRDLAHDCPWWNERARKYEPHCGARFVDLDRNLPPVDRPDEPMYCRRGPAREDLPKPQHVDRYPATSNGTGPMLSGWAVDEVGYACRRCPRGETFTKDGLLRRFGDQRLTDLLRLMTASCPRRGSTNYYELCGASYVMPGEQSDTPGE